MNNVFVYLEIEGTTVADVSLELLTKGRKLANQLGCQLEAVAAGNNLAGIEKQVLPFGVDKLHVFDAPGLFPYTSLPHSSVLINLFKEEQPQICLMGATVIGRDLGPRVSSALTSGLTADCTSLEIGSHEDKKEGKTYENLLYQIRPSLEIRNQYLHRRIRIFFPDSPDHLYPMRSTQILHIVPIDRSDHCVLQTE